MKCSYHPDVDAVGACINCGRLICAECKTVVGGKIYCNPCADKRPTVDYKLIISSSEAISGVKKILTRRNRKLEVSIPAGIKTGQIVKLGDALQITDGYSGDVVIRIEVKAQSWFERHLNWTVILVVVISDLLWIFTGSLFALYLAVIASSIAVGWALKRKCRRLWWLLIFFAPCGWIAFLCIENRSEFVNIKSGLIARIRQAILMKRAKTRIGYFTQMIVRILVAGSVLVLSIWTLRILFSSPSILVIVLGFFLWPIPYWDSIFNILNMIIQKPTPTLPFF